ncbi:type I restriction-modification system subunit M [Ruegeria atlantica]|uniref:type I restriction-modification system subunit M n=1 Tax=Ruegeria atlantica TaxID=81569 RepID=UPI00147E34B7|nr:type I restriction-modification system subunit M [Ruegeria atlantica]
MTGQQQAEALRREIWSIANRVRGAVDGWDFKQFVLGALFYRFISENFTNYIEGGDDSINYAGMSDADIPDEAKVDAVKTKGYFIYPSQLFQNVVKAASKNDSLNTDLAEIFSAIEASASGYPSEQDINGLFADFDTTSNRLGSTVKQKNERLAEVLKGVAGLPLKFDDNEGDLFGDAYEFLISNYAANAGKSGGEFFTPTHVSKLIAKLAMHKQTSVNKIYDPAAGSGSLLLQAKEEFEKHIIEDGFFGQEINYTTYNLARMNMFLHNINYDKFNIQYGNTLEDPHFQDDKPFDAIVSNPPYSVKWKGADDPTLINDDRFSPAGVLAPKSKADFAFVLHALHYLSAKGRAAIVCFPGIFYRGGAEQKIRKYLVDNNFVETVIALAPNLFFGTTIAVNILVLAKNKTDTAVQFIDATEEKEFFRKGTNTNLMDDPHIAKVIELFDSKANVPHIAETVPYEVIVENDYNLSVSAYVEPKDTSEVIDIQKLNTELAATVDKINKLRADIDEIVKSQQSNITSQGSNNEGIEWTPLGEIGEFVRGNGLQKKDLKEHGFPAIHYGQIFTRYGLIADRSFTFVTEEFASRLKKARKNDLLLATTSENDEDVVKPLAWLGAEVAISGDMMLFRHAQNVKYLAYFFQTEAFQKQKRKFITGAKVRRVSSSDLAKIVVPIPFRHDRAKSLAEQARIVDILDKFETMTSANDEGLSREIELRQKQYHYYREHLLSVAETGAGSA